MRIATWNVERPKPAGWKVPPAQLRRMAHVEADIWVLTETHLHHAPSPEHRHVVFTPPHSGRPDPERYTAIWSRWPLTCVVRPPPNGRGSVTALVETPTGELLVYGTVIAWANERSHADGRPAAMWQVHLEEIERQAAEWAELRRLFPSTPLVVAGDLNQDRDGSGWYGTRRTRMDLTTGLAGADLVCVADQDVVAEGLLAEAHLVDHICVSSNLAAGTTLRCWERYDELGQRLSDHPVVAIDVDWPLPGDVDEASADEPWTRRS